MTTALPELKAPFVTSDAQVLRAAFVMPPTATIAAVAPVHGESNAIAERAREQFDVFASRLAAAGVKLAVPEGEFGRLGSLCADLAVFFPRGRVLDASERFAPPGGGCRGRGGADASGCDDRRENRIAGPARRRDVLRASDTVFLGIPRRRQAEVGIPVAVHGNAAGREQLAAYARAQTLKVVEVAMNADVLRLRSVASLVDLETLVYAPGVIDGSALQGFKLLEAPRGEELRRGRFNARPAAGSGQSALSANDPAPA